MTDSEYCVLKFISENNWLYILRANVNQLNFAILSMPGYQSAPRYFRENPSDIDLTKIVDYVEVYNL